MPSYKGKKYPYTDAGKKKLKEDKKKDKKKKSKKKKSKK
jgi:hypothetical protein|tara:strand:- start:676 stop:792 length:117 start_codon:yes stop_codon:yes gene_type:complete